MRIDKCRCMDPCGLAAMAGFDPAQHVVPSSLPVSFQLDFKLLVTMLLLRGALNLTN